MALAFDISIDKLPSGVTTADQLCALVSEIIRKAAPNIPSDKTLEDMGVAEEALLVVASTDNDNDPFRPQDHVRAWSSRLRVVSSFCSCSCASLATWLVCAALRGSEHLRSASSR